MIPIISGLLNLPEENKKDKRDHIKLLEKREISQAALSFNGSLSILSVRTSHPFLRLTPLSFYFRLVVCGQRGKQSVKWLIRMVIKSQPLKCAMLGMSILLPFFRKAWNVCWHPLQTSGRQCWTENWATENQMSTVRESVTLFILRHELRI